MVNRVVESLIKRVEYWNGTVPKKEIRILGVNRKESIPYLRDILKKVLKNPLEYLNKRDYMGHKVAIYMLAQFRCKEAFEDILKLYSLPNEIAYELLGYNVTYDESRVLASCYNGDMKLLTDVIENDETYEVNRNACIDTLKILALQAVLDRSKVIEYYRSIIEGATDKKERRVECAVSYSLELYPKELMEDIDRLYEEKKLDEGIVFRESFYHTLEMDKREVLECYRSQTSNSFIKSILDEDIFWQEISGDI